MMEHKKYEHDFQKGWEPKMNITKKLRGFTIIEVVLVLAIASLIFLMVFIALPALQKSQRDTARKNEVGTIVAAITTYSSNNRGALPTANSSFAGYINGTYAAGTGITLNSGTVVKDAALPANATTTTAADVSGMDVDTIVIVPKAACATGKQVTKGNNRQAAVIVGLEAGDGTSVFYCANT